MGHRIHISGLNLSWRQETQDSGPTTTTPTHPGARRFRCQPKSHIFAQYPPLSTPFGPHPNERGGPFFRKNERKNAIVRIDFSTEIKLNDYVIQSVEKVIRDENIAR